MKTREKDYLFLDSNVRESFFKDSDRYNKFSFDFFSNYGLHIGSFRCLITPLSILELIGFKGNGRIDPVSISLEKITKLNATEIDGPEHNKLLEELAVETFQLNFKKISELEDLTQSQILSKLKNKILYVKIPSIPIYGDLYYKEIVPTFDVSVIHTWLALDRVQATFYNDVKSYHLNRYLYITMAKFMEDGRNNSFARLSHRIWMDLWNRLDHVTDKNKEELELIKKNCNFKEGSDLVDTDIVHLACCGKLIGGYRYQVKCVTQDPILSVVMRVSQYKSYLKNMKEDFAGCKNINFPPGEIIFLNKDSSIRVIIHVKDIPPMFDLYEKNGSISYLLSNYGREDLACLNRIRK